MFLFALIVVAGIAVAYAERRDRARAEQLYLDANFVRVAAHYRRRPLARRAQQPYVLEAAPECAGAYTDEL